MNDEKVITIENVTKNYGQGRGNFDINIDLHRGGTIGIVGENGAGKTTLLRQIMGFLRSDSGNIEIYGRNAWNDAADAKQFIGYIPGEINFPDVPTGIDFLHQYGASLGMKSEDFAYADEIIKRMQLDIRAYPRRMSKGMKQKTSIVAAFMLKSPILLLDEPSTGLDPLMREELLELILEQKKRGASIIVTSNAIEELERVCDTVLLMSHGQILDTANMEEIKNRPYRDYKVEFLDENEYEAFTKKHTNIIRIQPQYHQATIRVHKDNIPALLDELSNKKFKFMTEVPYTLATYFTENRKAKEINQHAE